MIIGIDLGTTNSLACVYRNGHTELIPNALGEYMTKSAVSVLEDGTVLIGTAAKERLFLHPEQTAVSFKRWMGTERAVRLGGEAASKQFLPHELSALVLKQLYEDARRYLGEEIEEAVISVPAYFDDNQRNATKLAAQLAGIPVKRLINEPSAAALKYSLNLSDRDCRLMVIDFGGGTLDVSIVECFENIIEIIAIAGDNRLGGDDIDRAVAEYFCKANSLSMERLPAKQKESLIRQAEAAKKALSEDIDSQASKKILLQESYGAVPEAMSSESAPPVIRLTLEKTYELSLDKSLLRKICQPYLNRIKAVIGRAVRDSRLTPDALDDIVLVGGSARLAVLGDYLEELMGRRPVLTGRPDYMVAEGTGICAGIKSRREELRDVVMTDVCPFSLGIAVCNDERDQIPHMAVMIARSSMLPISRKETFYTLHDGQTCIRLEIYQGEEYYVSENRKLGEMMMRVPPGAAGEHSVEVAFAYDINGILHVDAKASGGDCQETVIVNPKVQLGEEELRKKVEELKRLSYAAEGNQEDFLYIAKAERMYAELIGREKEQAGKLLDAYRQVLRQANLIELQKMRKQARTQIEAWEAYVNANPWQNQDAEVYTDEGEIE